MDYKTLKKIYKDADDKNVGKVVMNVEDFTDLLNDKEAQKYLGAADIEKVLQKGYYGQIKIDGQMIDIFVYKTILNLKFK